MRAERRTLAFACSLLFASITLGSRTLSANGPHAPHPGPALPPQDATETVFSTNASNDLLLRLDFRTGTAAVVNSFVDAIVRRHLEGIVVRDDPPGVSVIACDSLGGKVVFYPKAQGPDRVTGQVIARIDAPDGVSLDTAGSLYLVSSPFGSWQTPRVWSIPKGGSRPGGYGNPVVIDPQVPADALEDTKVVNFTAGALAAGDLLVVAQRPATLFRYRKGPSGWQRAVFIPPSRFPLFARPTGITFTPSRELLVSTFGGDILRFDPSGARRLPNFASGCGNGRLKIASGIQEGKSRVFVANRSNGGKILRFLFRADGTGAPDGGVDERVNRPNGVGIASNSATPTPTGDSVEIVPAPEITLKFDTVTEAGLTQARLIEFVDNRDCDGHACDQGLREFFPGDPQLQALVPDITVPSYVQGIPKLLPNDPPGQPTGPSSFLLALIDTTAKFRRTVDFHAEEEKRGLFTPCAWLGSPTDQLHEPRTFYAPETAAPKSEPDLVENSDGPLFVDISNGCGSNKGSGWNFSLYLTGTDTRTPLQIVQFKVSNLQAALSSFEEFIDPSVFADLAGNLSSANAALNQFASSGNRTDRDNAQAAIEEFRATIDGNVEAFDNAAAGRNVSGELVARAASILFILPKAPTATGPLITEFPLPTPGSLPIGIVTGPDGNLWFGLWGAIGRITLSGQITEFPLPSGAPSGAGAAAVTAAIDGKVWFSKGNQNLIGSITPAGVITEYPMPVPQSFPGSVVEGPDGAVWFKQQNPDRFSRLDPATGSISDIALPAMSQPPGFLWSMNFDADGNIWYARGQAIGRMTPGGVFTEFPVPTPGSYPTQTLAAPDGNVWFTENAIPNVGRVTPSGAITEFPSPPHPASRLFATAIGPDGNVWFANELADLIGRITPSGVITEFPIPTPGGYVLGMTTGPDGNLWFTELSGNKIGRLSQ